MTVIEQLQADLAAAEAEVSKIEAEIAAMPSMFHDWEMEIWVKLKSYFYHPTVMPTPAPTVPPVVPPAG